jgi:two-component system response regulator RegA
MAGDHSDGIRIPPHFPGKAKESRDGGQARLLLVDDDEILCAVLARALERKGFRVAVAHHPQAALAAAAERPPEFAVVDLKFPDGSGLDLVRQLLGLHKGMRVVVLTGYASIATAVEATKLGAHYYLTKPIGADDLVEALLRDSVAESAPIREKPLSVNRLEWEHINRVLTVNKGNISATARLLGMHRRTLQRKLSKHPARD